MCCKNKVILFLNDRFVWISLHTVWKQMSGADCKLFLEQICWGSQVLKLLSHACNRWSINRFLVLSTTSFICKYFWVLILNVALWFLIQNCKDFTENMRKSCTVLWPPCWLSHGQHSLVPRPPCVIVRVCFFKQNKKHVRKIISMLPESGPWISCWAPKKFWFHVWAQLATAKKPVSQSLLYMLVAWDWCGETPVPLNF